MLTFGSRTIMELAVYIAQEIGPLPHCHMCQEPATVHCEWCLVQGCGTVLHLACRNKVFKEKGKCPECRAVLAVYL